MRTLPLVRIEVELEGPTTATKVHMPTYHDEERMGRWLEANPATIELLDWINKWGELGQINPPAIVRDVVADPFTASGQL